CHPAIGLFVSVSNDTQSLCVCKPVISIEHHDNFLWLGITPLDGVYEVVHRVATRVIPLHVNTGITRSRSDGVFISVIATQIRCHIRFPSLETLCLDGREAL